MNEYLPIPAKLYVGPRKSIDGQDVTMVIGFLPGKMFEKDEILTAELIIADTEKHDAGKYHGWLAEDILRDGIQIEK